MPVFHWVCNVCFPRQIYVFKQETRNLRQHPIVESGINRTIKTTA
jgi:hypothetical protein